MEISGDSFPVTPYKKDPKDPYHNGIVLSGGSIGTLRIPEIEAEKTGRPYPVALADLAVKSWDINGSADDVRPYLHLLAKDPLFQRSNYTAIETYLRNRGTSIMRRKYTARCGSRSGRNCLEIFSGYRTGNGQSRYGSAISEVDQTLPLRSVSRLRHQSVAVVFPDLAAAVAAYPLYGTQPISSPHSPGSPHTPVATPVTSQARPIAGAINVDEGRRDLDGIPLSCSGRRPCARDGGRCGRSTTRSMIWRPSGPHEIFRPACKSMPCQIRRRRPPIARTALRHEQQQQPTIPSNAGPEQHLPFGSQRKTPRDVSTSTTQPLYRVPTKTLRTREE